EVKRFFQTLRDQPRYRSVHLFKYPFRDARTGQSAALAIYGILVSSAEPAETALAYYDRKFRSTFRFANQRQGDPPPPLFPGREHLKLKNLHVDALELQAVPNLEVVLDDPQKGMFKEGQKIQLELAGKIQSYLTQHSVTGGHYRLEFAGPFKPETWAANELGARDLEGSSFPASDGEIQEPIPPSGSLDIKAVLRSSQPVSFKSPGPAAWLRLAVSGAVVKYTGTVKMSLDPVPVKLERDQMAGIFGIGQASGIFDFQDVTRLSVAPSEAPVSFTLKSGVSRTAVFLVVLLVLAVLLGVLAVVLAQKRWYYVRITGTPERLIPLRRLGSYAVVHDGQPLGRLSRGISGEHEFLPNPPSAAVTITPAAQPDTYDVHFRDNRGCQLSIEPRGGRKKPPKPPRTGPGPTIGRPSPPGNLPKIDRPNLPKIDRP